MQEGLKVAITGEKVSSLWKYDVGTIIRWLHDDWYLIECRGMELVLSLDEFVVIK